MILAINGTPLLTKDSSIQTVHLSTLVVNTPLKPGLLLRLTSLFGAAAV
jgi:hypothetical protein